LAQGWWSLPHSSRIQGTKVSASRFVAAHAERAIEEKYSQYGKIRICRMNEPIINPGPTEIRFRVVGVATVNNRFRDSFEFAGMMDEEGLYWRLLSCSILAKDLDNKIKGHQASATLFVERRRFARPRKIFA
jgi:hypothetical protein